MNVNEQQPSRESQIPAHVLEITQNKAKLAECDRVKLGDQQGYLVYQASEIYNGEKVELNVLYDPYESAEEVGEEEVFVESAEEVFVDISFVYTVANEPVAAVVFSKEEEDIYTSAHRYVDMEKPTRKGMGTALLKKAEQFFQLMVNSSQQPMEMEMPIAQVPVLEWAIKNGYQVGQTDQAEVDAIINDYRRDGQSSNFVFADNTTAINGKPFLRDGYIFKKDQPNRDIFSAQRFVLSKTIEPEEIK